MIGRIYVDSSFAIASIVDNHEFHEMAKSRIDKLPNARLCFSLLTILSKHFAESKSVLGKILPETPSGWASIRRRRIALASDSDCQKTKNYEV